MRNVPSIEKYVRLSMRHLDLPGVAWLFNNPYFAYPVRWSMEGEAPGSFFVYAENVFRSGENIPVTLRRCLNYAKSRGCSLVNFDLLEEPIADPTLPVSSFIGRFRDMKYVWFKYPMGLCRIRNAEGTEFDVVKKCMNIGGENVTVKYYWVETPKALRNQNERVQYALNNDLFGRDVVTVTLRDEVEAQTFVRDHIVPFFLSDVINTEICTPEAVMVPNWEENGWFCTIIIDRATGRVLDHGEGNGYQSSEAARNHWSKHPNIKI